VEGELFRKAGEPTQGLSGFLRLGMADQNVNQIQYYTGGGLAYTGLLPGREDDVAGFGVSVGFNGRKFKQAQRLAGSPVDGEEIAFEWTYRLKLFPWMSLQFDAQYIKNPGTDPTLKNALLFGFRHKITF
jgi:porin